MQTPRFNFHRFFLPKEYIHSDYVNFPEPIARQIRNVLRVRPGEHVIVLDNHGSKWEVVMQELTRENVRGEILYKTFAGGEPLTKLNLYFSLTRREKMEWILQKCTEIGVVSFTPVICINSLARDMVVDVSRKRRWEKIVQEAAEQSERGKLPVVNEPAQLHQAIKKVRAGKAQNLVAWEGEKNTSLREVLHGNTFPLQTEKKINLFIGPEGGFASSEIELFIKAGVRSFSLGERILRVETAAMVSCALILFELEK